MLSTISRYLSGSVAPLSIILLSSTGAWAQTVTAPVDANGTTRTVADGAMIDSTGDYALRAQNNGVINAGDNVILSASTRFEGAVTALSGGQINLKTASIPTFGMGIVANGIGSTVTSTGMISINTSRVGQYGVYGENSGIIDLDSANITTGQDASHGVVASTAATVTIRGGTINTRGTESHGLFAHLDGAHVEGSNLSIKTTGQNAAGAQANDNGSINLSNSTITTDGSAAHGLYAIGDRATLTANNVQIKTNGNNAHGAYVLGSGVGVSGIATMTLDHMDILTTGNQSDGVRVEKGHATITNSVIETDAVNSNADTYTLAVLGTDSAGQPSTLDATNVNLFGSGAYTDANAVLMLNHVDITTTEHNRHGLTASGNSRIDATDVNIVTSGFSAYGVILQNGTVNLSGSAIRTTGRDATGIFSVDGTVNRVNLDNSSITTENGYAFEVSNGSQLTLNVKNRSVVSSNNDELFDFRGGNANVTVDDSELSGNIHTENGAVADLKLSNNSIYKGAVQIEYGTATLALDTTSSWVVTGSSEITSLTNHGTVAFDNQGDYKVLSVAGDYAGGGTLVINTVLEDDNSSTDMLKVGGDTSGDTTLVVNNRGGLGAQTVNGIEVIDVAGQSDGTFTLKGDYTTKDGQQAILTPTAYAYTLHKNGGDWYLTSAMTSKDPDNPPDNGNPDNGNPDNNNPDNNNSDNGNPDNSGPNHNGDGDNPPDTPRYSAAAPVYESYAATLQTLNRLPTLRQRVGDRYRSDSAHRSTMQGGENEPYAIWGRVESAHNRFEPDSTTGNLHQDINTYILQAGVDGLLYEDAEGRLIGGITGQYGNAHASIANYFGDGTIDTQGWGLGGTLTWYGDSGLYIDGQVQANWYDSDLDINGSSPTLRSGTKGFGYAMSVEAGQRIKLDENWSLTPQAQFMWSSVDFDTFTDAYGARISNRNGNSLATRIGIAANYAESRKGEDGRAIDTSVYGIANLYQEFLGDTKVNYAGTHLGTNNDSTWGGIGLGGTYAWADSKYAIYGEGSINTSLDHFADGYTLKGNIGFRTKW